MPKKSKKTEADWANVIRVYEEVIREAGEYATAAKKSFFYRKVADKTNYSEETVKRIIMDSFKPVKKTAAPL